MRAGGGKPPRVVLAYPPRGGGAAHEAVSQEALACKIAGLLGYEYMTEDEFVRRGHAASPYLVPGDTLIGPRRLVDPRLSGVHGEQDFFGGMAPHAFVATKAITHPLIDPRAHRPAGWSADFCQRVRGAVLRGVTVFSLDDARRAGRLLLDQGRVRAKPVLGTGGRGQCVVSDGAALDAFIHEQDEPGLAECGLVLEEHLEEVQTYSVGRVRVGELVCAYVGTQSLTADSQGQPVYGGSELRLVRGGFETLLASALSDDERMAVRLALTYDRAALHCYPGLVASRRNYDVARGIDAAGTVRFGVLEQSWRAGGASMAEACALEVFQQQPEIRCVHAFTCERYGDAHLLPPGARVVYQGEDAQGGTMTKYAGVSPHDGR